MLACFSFLCFEAGIPAQAVEVLDDLAPEPRLLAPIKEEVDLTGKDSLEFKWSPFEGQMWERRFYDFRLYKGYQLITSAEMYVQRVDPKKYSVVLAASLFEDGQIYTWAVRQVYYDLRKSDAVSVSFKVIKK